jgi:hypothetical protein
MPTFVTELYVNIMMFGNISDMFKNWYIALQTDQIYYVAKFDVNTNTIVWTRRKDNARSFNDQGDAEAVVKEIKKSRKSINVYTVSV